MKDDVLSSIKLYALLIFLWAVMPAYSGTTGKIAGNIVDSNTGEPLTGVNIVIDDSYLGAASDLDGYYYIINISPGIYNLTFSSVGFTSQRISQVIVNIDKTTNINLEMEPSVIEGEAVIVIAKRKNVEFDRTFSTSTVSVADLKAMPIARLQEAIEVQAGIVDGHFRGGRKGEVVYMIDDIPIQDPYDNTQATMVNQDAVQELQVISGTFNAEYGQAMSGIVNIVTKEGASSFSGQLSVQAGDYLSTHDDIFYNIGNINPAHLANYDGSLSGPISFIPDLTFFVNGRYEDNEGWYYGQRRWAAEHPVLLNFGSVESVNLERGDMSAVPMNPNESLFLFGKLTYPLTPYWKLNYSTLFDNRNYKDYDHGWRYVPDGDYKRHRRSRTNILKSSTALNRASVVEFSIANTFTEYFHFVYEDPYDSRYVHPLYEQNPAVTLKFGGTKYEHFRRFTDTHTAKAKLSWQLNPLHYVVAGAIYTGNKISYDQFTIINRQDELSTKIPGELSPLVFENTVEDATGLNTDRYTNNPMEAAFFIQDKIELKGFIINAGIRFDYFDPDGKILSDPQDPNIYNPLLVERRNHTLTERQAYWYKKPEPKTQFSPRLGIAYAISPTGVLHFAYGHFFQRPKYEYLYTNPDFELGTDGSNTTLLGNADLEAEQTTSYEFGLEQGMTDDLVVSVSIYQRNIQKLVSSDHLVTTYDAGTKYSMYTNRDFGEIRGIVLALDKYYSNNISGSIDYTYQVAEGNASEPADAFNAAKGNKEPIKQLLPLDWDRRHTINLVFNYQVPGKWGLTLLGTYGSGLPYTSEKKGDDSPILVLFENDSRKPAYFNIDLNSYKEIPLKANLPVSATITLMIRNLFDIKNENNVFADTGRATYTRDEELLKHQEIAFINTIEELLNHPEFYSRPREVRVGLRLVF